MTCFGRYIGVSNIIQYISNAYIINFMIFDFFFTLLITGTTDIIQLCNTVISSSHLVKKMLLLILISENTLLAN